MDHSDDELHGLPKSPQHEMSRRKLLVNALTVGLAATSAGIAVPAGGTLLAAVTTKPRSSSTPARRATREQQPAEENRLAEPRAAYDPNWQIPKPKTLT